eukprot:635341-Rhodomonas_salina.1
MRTEIGHSGLSTAPRYAMREAEMGDEMGGAEMSGGGAQVSPETLAKATPPSLPTHFSCVCVCADGKGGRRGH